MKSQIAQLEAIDRDHATRHCQLVADDAPDVRGDVGSQREDDRRLAARRRAMSGGDALGHRAQVGVQRLTVPAQGDRERTVTSVEIQLPDPLLDGATDQRGRQFVVGG